MTIVQLKLARGWKVKGFCALIEFVFVASQSPKVSLADVCPLVSATEERRVEMFRMEAPDELIVVTYRSVWFDVIAVVDALRMLEPITTPA